MSRKLHIVAPALLLAFSGVAHAATTTSSGLSPIPSGLPARCQALTPIPEQTLNMALSDRVSVSNCLAEDAMNKLTLAPDDASKSRLDAATRQSIAMLDNVIAQGDPYWTMVAEDAKRDTYTSMAVRLRNSVPPGDIAARNRVDNSVATWLRGASDANARVAELAGTHRDIAARDPVIAGITQRATTGQAVASRACECTPMG